MNVNPVVLAIPLFFLLMGLEILIEQLTNRSSYRLADSIANISCGITQQLVGLFLKILTIGAYQFIFEGYSIFSLARTNWFYWPGLFLLVDVSYYFGHRISHEVNLFWAAHIVHHQSEEFNYSVALRQSSFSIIWFSSFNLPIALLGFSTLDFVFVSALNTLYQFWIHTEIINKLGWLEFFMNTPSHHRVHHGRDPKYIDKNHGGMFIIWDKLFKTFQEEEEKPTYGITKPINSWNAVYANFSHYAEILDQWRKMISWNDRIRYLFKKPGWLPDYLGGPEQVTAIDPSYKKYQTQASLKLRLYSIFQFALSTISTVVFLNFESTFSLTEKLFISLLICFSITNCGALLEGRKWARWGEYSRIIVYPVLLTALAYYNNWPEVFHLTTFIYFLISFPWFYSVQAEISKSKLA